MSVALTLSGVTTENHASRTFPSITCPDTGRTSICPTVGWTRPTEMIVLERPLFSVLVVRPCQHGFASGSPSPIAFQPGISPAGVLASRRKRSRLR